MIQKMTVKLPFQEQEHRVCDICGDVVVFPDAFHPEESRELLQKPDVAIGDVVEISVPYPYGSSNIVREKCTVDHLFYAKKNEFLYVRGPKNHRPELHELCIGLKYDISPSGYSWFSTTYREFRALRDGGTKALQDAGVLPLPKPPGIISRLFLGFPKK